MIDKTTTDELLKILENTQNEKDLENYIYNVDEKISLIEYLESKMYENNLNKSDLIRLSNIQRNYGYQIFDGTKKPGRDKIIALCISLKLSFKETQKALKISDNSALYPKVKRDSIIIFSINKQFSVLETNELLDELNQDPLK